MHACYLIESFMWQVGNWVNIEDICLNTGLTYKTVYYLNDSDLAIVVMKNPSSTPQTYKLAY